MHTPWRIELLGRLRATQGDRVVTRFRARKTGALLAYLAYSMERPHPREVLIELLWPETDPRSGRSSLSRELTSLRRQLEPPGVPAGAVIVADRHSVQLNPAACATDVQAFETALQLAARAGGGVERAARLTESAELYGGELLPGYFEDWILTERQRLAERFLRALEQLTAHLEQAGDHHGAIQWARRAVAADPLREEGHHELIRLLAAAGEPAAAVRQYQELERLLAPELGATPAPETGALVSRAAGWPVGAHSLRSQAGRSSRFRREDALPSPEPLSGPRRHDGDNSTASIDSVSPTPAAVSPSTSPLPFSFTRFFGREREIEYLRELLLAAPVRLVTLVGPGGTGKTRLALETARQVQPLAGRAWFVSLLDLTDSRLIADKLLESLRIPRSPQVEPLDQITAFLSADPSTGAACRASRPSLLVLDNFEHLVEGGRDLVRTLLERVESLTVLVTSRRCLGLEGEQEFPVPPLPVPEGPWPTVDSPTATNPSDPSDPSDPSTINHQLSTLTQFPSVALFVDRAQAVRPDFQVTRTNAGAIAALCAALEGLPLALELAAARTGVLTPQQMLVRLQQRFELLGSGRRGADPRHRSLRATLDWSYQLLSPELQQFFARLSVFRGGWTLEAAEAVCEEPWTLRWLEELRQCSLVQAGDVGREMRFRLLETLREYGAEQLGPEAQAAVAHRHASYYVTLAERAEPELVRAEQVAWLDRLEREHDNLRSALAWLEASGRTQEALRLGGALWRFWHMRGHQREGQEWLMRLLARDEGSECGDHSARVRRARALNAAGILAWYQGDYETTRRLAEESLAIGRELNDRRTILFSLTNLGFVAHGRTEFDEARAYFEESLAIARELGDLWNIADTLNTMGELARYRGNVEEARPLLEEGLLIFRDLGDKQNIAVSLRDLGLLTRAQGDLEAARTLLEESLALRRELGDQRGGALTLYRLGELAADQADCQGARALCEESLILLRQLGERRGVAHVLAGRAEVALREGDCDMVHTLLAEAMPIARALGDRPVQGIALNLMALAALYQGDYPAARTLAQESLAIEPGADTKDLLGFVALHQGEFATARAFCEESLAIERRRTQRPRVARTLCHLGETALLEGDLSAARSLLEEALAIQREVGLKFELPFTLNNWGLLALHESDLAAAKARFEQSLTIGREAHNQWAVAESLSNLGLVASRQGHLEAAGSLQAESLAIRRRLGARPGIADSLRALGGLLLQQGDLAADRLHYAESRSLPPSEVMGGDLPCCSPPTGSLPANPRAAKKTTPPW